MIYSFTLSQVALVLGLVYLAGHLWTWKNPAMAKHLLQAFPRHYPAGVALMGVATLWFAFLLSTIDLMEYTPHQTKFIFVVLTLGTLTAIYVREFLAVRAFGAILLLLAQVLLDSAFLRDEISRLVVTVTAYVYVMVGLFLIGMPYILRDAVAFVFAHETRAKAFAAGGAAFGLLLVLLALFVY
jgi:hypothetical protein